MGVTQTSLSAYRKIEPELGARQQEVFDTLVGLGRASNQTLAKTLRWSINRVTPRVNELVKLGKVEVDGTELGEYGHPAKVWKPSEKVNNQADFFSIEQDCSI